MTVSEQELKKLGFEEGPELEAARAHAERENLSGLDLLLWAAEAQADDAEAA